MLSSLKELEGKKLNSVDIEKDPGGTVSSLTLHFAGETKVQVTALSGNVVIKQLHEEKVVSTKTTETALST